MQEILRNKKSISNLKRPRSIFQRKVRFSARDLPNESTWKPPRDTWEHGKHWWCYEVDLSIERFHSYPTIHTAHRDTIIYNSNTVRMQFRASFNYFKPNMTVDFQNVLPHPDVNPVDGPMLYERIDETQLVVRFDSLFEWARNNNKNSKTPWGKNVEGEE